MVIPPVKLKHIDPQQPTCCRLTGRHFNSSWTFLCFYVFLILLVLSSVLGGMTEMFHMLISRLPGSSLWVADDVLCLCCDGILWTAPQLSQQQWGWQGCAEVSEQTATWPAILYHMVVVLEASFHGIIVNLVPFSFWQKFITHVTENTYRFSVQC